MKIVIVVADIFEKFTHNEGVSGAKEVLQKLREVNEWEAFSNSQLIAGQGLSELEVDHIYCLALSRGVEKNFAYWRLWRNKAPADKKTSHKHNPKNVLVSTPTAKGDDCFESDFIIHHENELMQDHLTGEHVQGMVLIEACRQMFLAVKEEFYLKEFPSDKKYFVINELNIKYLAFAFPVNGKVRYKAISTNRPRSNKLEAHAHIEINQNGISTVFMDVKFTVFDGAVLSAKESQLSEAAVSAARAAAVARIEEAQNEMGNNFRAVHLWV